MHLAQPCSTLTRVRIEVRGIVQGVGFRPFVYSLARRHSLKGLVLNNTAGVLIDVEGDDDAIGQFIEEIRTEAPPLALVESIESSSDLDPAHYEGFRIVESTDAGEKFVPVSADVATCADCRREMADPTDRRYRYPFINCTNCGPRFTIVEATPYDRARTTMRDFVMCDECRAEYENPLDRRFHAEPIACWTCGPRLRLTDARGCEAEFDETDGTDIIGHVRRLVLSGKIVAIKGVGGYHLACDALDAEAVERLRGRKYREDKPFALMASSVEVVRRHCVVSEAEESLLTSARRPVVLLARKADSNLPDAIAPGVNTLGFMLPYTPLHQLLLEDLDRPLVMTSGNVSDEPICYEDEDAGERLHSIADYLLLHDRRIHMRTDDSVVRVHDGREMVLRRSRGYAPAPVSVAFKFGREILACGAELKNTFCLARDHHAFVSHHIGDLENLETLRSYQQGIEHFKRLFQLRPEIVVHDLHPEYLSTKYALALDEGFERVGVQHHHAHVASCMADNRIEGEVIGVAMDGLGFGTDGRMWGGEFFVADFVEAERVAHLDYVPMPGGAKAVREPWRMAAVYLHRTFGDDFLNLDLPFVRKLNRHAWATLSSMTKSGTNSPETSSIGRLFDAVAGLLCLRSSVNYEGQAAIELETLADRACEQGYEFRFDEDRGVIKAEGVVRAAAEDLLEGLAPTTVSAKFHLGVAALIASVACRVREERRLNRVVLSGGVFQNMFLLGRARRALKCDGFEVFTHGRVPTNDGGISLGQAAIANARLAAGRI
ncbi:MAG: hydrogenase maturation protein HypF [Acidobacteriota bacterium]|jgi:hydrogenase maturation protein HypF|nr:hydrogenase maturation protein HypF [Acidobacteriota bacterium]